MGSPLLGLLYRNHCRKLSCEVHFEYFNLLTDLAGIGMDRNIGQAFLGNTKNSRAAIGPNAWVELRVPVFARSSSLINQQQFYVEPQSVDLSGETKHFRCVSQFGVEAKPPLIK